MSHESPYACNGIRYHDPSIREIEDSPLGCAIVTDDVQAVRNYFDGPAGWRKIVHWFLMDEDRLRISLIQSFIYAMQYPSETTGQVAMYLWGKIKRGCVHNSECENGLPAILAYDGNCILLNAFENEHEQILVELLEHPIMHYAITSVAHHALQMNHTSLLMRCAKAASKFNNRLLIEALYNDKTNAAIILAKFNVSLAYCNLNDGSVLHMAIVKQFSLLRELIKKVPDRVINCLTLFQDVDANGTLKIDEKGNIITKKRTPLDALLYDKRILVDEVRELLARGAVCGPDTSIEGLEIANKLREKFGMAKEEACWYNVTSNQKEGCLPLRKLLF